MCGRFTLINWEDLILRFGIRAAGLKPRYNIAPTQIVPAIVPGKELKMLYWGFIPFWAKDKAIGNKMINARAETLAEKKSFRYNLRHKRCLIPADGFYEWEKKGQEKIPYRYTLKNAELFAFAGLWESWQSPMGEQIESFCIITTSANELVKKLHGRMPVILSREAEEIWLDPQINDPVVLLPLLKPYPAEKMTVTRVSRKVNNPANDFPEVLLPD